MTEQKRLRVALQKSGKLSEGSLDLLNKCSFKLRPAKNHYLIQSKEMNTDFLMIRDDDIPGFVDSNASDIGIVGENGYVEYILENPEHDLEIIPLEKRHVDHRFFLKITIPSSYKPSIKEELGILGVNKMSIYPGIDGVVEKIKEECGLNDK